MTALYHEESWSCYCEKFPEGVKFVLRAFAKLTDGAVGTNITVRWIYCTTIFFNNWNSRYKVKLTATAERTGQDVQHVLSTWFYIGQLYMA